MTDGRGDPAHSERASMPPAKDHLAGGAGGFLTEAGAPRAFVVVSSARSGSNLLVSYLRQVARAACFGEIFRSQFPQ